MGDERGSNQILKQKMSGKKQDLVLELVRCHPFLPVSVYHNDIGRCPAINLTIILSKDSTPAKDVGNTVDKTMIPV